MRKYIKLLLFCALLISAASCSTFRRLPPKEVVSSVPARLSDSISLLGKKLESYLPRSQRPSEDLKYLVDGTNVIQAQSGDSNEIVVTRGLLEVAGSEAEVAAVLAHEIGHNVLRHGERREESEEALTIPRWLDLGVPESWISATRDFLISRYSKQREQEADEFAVKLIAKAGYDPEALSRFFESVAQLADTGILERWERTHSGTHSLLKDRATNSLAIAQKIKLPKKEVLTTSSYRQVIERSLPSNITLTDLRALNAQLGLELQEQRAMSPQEFIQRMETLSRALASQRVRASLKKSLWLRQDQAESDLFLQELLFSRSEALAGAIAKEIFTALKLLGKMAVGSTPVIGDAIDFYEFLAGKDFYTGDKLNPTERTLAAVALIAGNRHLFQDGIEKAFLKEGDEGAKEAIKRLRRDQIGKPEPNPSKYVDLGKSEDDRIKTLNVRQWTPDKIKDVVENPAQTIKAWDHRSTRRGPAVDEPATAYLDKDLNYVVVNNKTGQVVHVNDIEKSKNPKNWHWPEWHPYYQGKLKDVPTE